MNNEFNEIMTPKQVAEYLQVHSKTVYDWIASGELPSIKLGPRSIRIKKSDIDDFLMERHSNSVLEEAKDKGARISTKDMKKKVSA